MPNSISILRKCLDELQKESPRRDYVIGLLEAIIEIGERPNGPGILVAPKTENNKQLVKEKIEEETDEAEILDARTKARIGEISSLAAKSVRDS